MKRRRLHPLSFGLLLSGATVLLVTATTIPLGIPGEWVWARIPDPTIPCIELLTILCLFLVAAGLAFHVDFRIPAQQRRKKVLGALAICLLGLFFDWQVLLSGRASLAENVVAVADKWSTGYLTQATKIEDMQGFLQSYNRFLALDQEASNHTDVHPPGNTLLSYWAMQLTCHSGLPVRSLTTALLSDWELQNIRKALVESRCYPPGRRISFDDFMHAAILIVFFLLLCLALAKGVLLLSLAGLQRSRLGMAALFLWTVPAPILFLGAYDPLYYLFTSILCLLVVKWSRNSGRWIPAATGCLLGLYTFFSIGFACVAFLLLVLLLLRDGGNAGAVLRQLAWAVPGALVMPLLCHLGQINIFETCWLVVRNNGRFFAEANRSALWILVNYLDYLLFVGPVPIVLLCRDLVRCLKRGWPANRFHWLLSLAYAITLVVLFTGSFSRGEMGRLTLLLIPFHILLAASGLQRITRAGRLHYCLALAALLACIAHLLVLRIGVRCVFVF